MKKRKNSKQMFVRFFFLCLFFQAGFDLVAQPVITSQPTSVTTCTNVNTYFCVSTSAGSPTYQWKMCATPGGVYVNVANGTPAGATYVSSTSSCLGVTFSTLTTYYYKCDVTSGGTTTTNSVSMTTVAGSGCGTGTKTYGSSTSAGWLDRARDIIPASDGLGVIMVGETAFDPTGLTDACIFKVNTTMNGAVVWGRDLGSNSGGNQDNFNAVVKNSAGNYVVAGQVMDASNSLQLYVAQYPQAGGAPTWTRKVGKANYEWGNDIIQHSNGDYYIAGYSVEDPSSSGSTAGQLYSARITSAGAVSWTRHIGFGTSYSTTPVEQAYSLVETGSGTTSGELILVGYTTKIPSGTNREIAIVRQTATGTLVSARALAPSSGTGNEVATSIIRCSTGGYVISGYTNSSGMGGYDFYIAKLNDDASLSVSWERTIGRAAATSNDFAWRVIETSDGGFVLAGYSTDASGNDDAYFVKVSSTGSLVWTRVVDIGGPTVDDVIYAITEMSDGTLAAAGFTKADPNSDILFLALNSDGTITSGCTNSSDGTINTPAFVYNDLADNNANASGTSGTESTNNVDLTGWPQASPCGVIILPVELKEFNVTCNGAKRNITWTTATEQNNDFFTIEHSTDAIHWEDLAYVKGSNSSMSDRFYQQIYTEESNEYRYYRLKQTDFNGDSKHFSIVTVTCTNKDKWLSDLYPNPTDNSVNLDMYSPNDGKAILQIIDITGRIVLEEERAVLEGNQTLTLSLTGFDKGAYMVRVCITETGMQEIKSLIKN